MEYYGPSGAVSIIQFELSAVHEFPDHEIYGQWIGLINESKGVGVQGFLRLSVMVLKEGEQPKIHGMNDLDADEVWARFPYEPIRAASSLASFLSHAPANRSPLFSRCRTSPFPRLHAHPRSRRACRRTCPS